MDFLTTLETGLLKSEVVVKGGGSETGTASGKDDVNDHVYEISVQRDGDSPNCGWRAFATNDGHNVFQLRTKNRTNCEHFALSAMKRYLKRGHRKTYRALANAAKEKGGVM